MCKIEVVNESWNSEDIRWLIEAKVRLSGESSNSFISYMPGTGKSTFAKKRHAKRLKVCHRCARWTCNATCRSLGMISINREDKIQFIKDGVAPSRAERGVAAILDWFRGLLFYCE